mmetsp:Transcript_84050/g.175812  ORF Transcript_84050/g.175812 Transcript_84050/m.175812 type:complete len:83 (-) Transcript_84050:316-564(-)
MQLERWLGASSPYKGGPACPSSSCKCRGIDEGSNEGEDDDMRGSGGASCGGFSGQGIVSSGLAELLTASTLWAFERLDTSPE